MGKTDCAHHYDILSQLTTKATLLDAWRLVQKKRSAGGVDQVSVAYYEQDFDRNIDRLLGKLREGRYVPEPYTRITIPKEGKPGELRPLSLPTISDKIVQQALKQLIEPVFNPLFQDISYAYRPKKGPVKAVNRISHIIASDQPAWVCCADIDNFFDSMDHDILIREFEKVIDETEIKTLIRMWMQTGVITPDQRYADTLFGIAQGGVISPILSNIYLHPFDSYLVERGARYVRYADNFVIFSKDWERMEADFEAARYFLGEVLKLRLNQEKSYFHRLQQGFSFIGIFFRGDQLRIDRDRIQRMEFRLKDLVKRHLPRDPRSFAEKLEQKVAGFENYYGRLKLQSGYPGFNASLQTTITEQLTQHYQAKGKVPSKTEVIAKVAGIRLFGERIPLTADSQWARSIADDCRAALKQREAPSAKPDDQAKSAADRAISKQKSKYKKLESVSREVIIESHGMFVGTSRSKLVAKLKGVKKFDIPLDQIENIDIKGKGVTLSSDIVFYCSKNKVPVFFSDYYGQPYAALQSPVFGDLELGLLQLQALQDGELCLYLVKEFIEGKVRNQINLLKYYKRNRAKDSLYVTELQKTLPEFDTTLERLKGTECGRDGFMPLREKIMGYEAAAARNYWKLVKTLLLDDVPDYPGRVRQGARDLVNSLLNYGYGFLYRQVWKEVFAAKLNPKIGFLHAYQGDKPILVYDLVEEFRAQAVDKVVLSMLTKHEPLKVNPKTGLLTEITRKKLTEGLLERQGTAVKYRGQKVLLKHVIREQVRDLCRYLRGDATYRCFICYY